MSTYLVKRLLQAVPLVFGIVTVAFFVVHFAPGDPAAKYYNPNVDPDLMREVRERFGFDQPLHVQYVRWLSAVAHGDLGISFTQHRPVADILRETIPNTLRLTVWALVLEIGLGIVLGTISAVRKYSALDHSLSALALFVYSVPSFWLGLMMIVVFSLKLGVLPASQMASVGAASLPFAARLWDRALHLAMPAFVLGVASAAGTARYMRASLIETIQDDYIRTARAKGVPESVVILKHAMRNALLPIVTLTGLYLPFLFSGAVVVEQIFAWPGMGSTMIRAIFARDYPIIMAVMMIAPVAVVIGNLLADLAYALVDPRIRYG